MECHCCSSLACDGLRLRCALLYDVCGWAEMLPEGRWLCCELERLVLVWRSSGCVLRCATRVVQILKSLGWLLVPDCGEGAP